MPPPSGWDRGHGRGGKRRWWSWRATSYRRTRPLVAVAERILKITWIMPLAVLAVVLIGSVSHRFGIVRYLWPITHPPTPWVSIFGARTFLIREVG